MWNVSWELCFEEDRSEMKANVATCMPVMPNCVPRPGWSIAVEKPSTSAGSSAETGPSGDAEPHTDASQNATTGPGGDAEPDPNASWNLITNYSRQIRITIPSQPCGKIYFTGEYQLDIRRNINHSITNEQLLLPRGELLDKLKKDLGFIGSLGDFRKRLYKMGYKWFATANHPIKYILLENSDLRLHREEYIQAIQQYRSNGRHIVYLDKYFDYFSFRGFKSCNTFTLNVISSNGTTPNSIDMFEIELNNNFEEKQFVICREWIRNKVIPNIPPNAVIVLVNLPCLDKILDPPPQSNANKMEMQSWLARNKVPFDLNMYKPQLFKLIMLNKDRVKKYAIDRLFEENSSRDHPVLRCPPRHPDLNMAHFFWHDVLSKLVRNPYTIRETLFNLIPNKFCRTSTSEIQFLQEQLIDIEREYERYDFAFDALTDHIQLVSKPSLQEGDYLNFESRALYVPAPIPVLNSDNTIIGVNFEDDL